MNKISLVGCVVESACGDCFMITSDCAGPYSNLFELKSGAYEILVSAYELCHYYKITEKTEEFDMIDKVMAFAKELETRRNAGWKSPTLYHVAEITEGKRYYKVCYGGSVCAFIDKTTGDIFKPAGCAAPAKHARGNINDDGGFNALDRSGYVLYMR